MDTLHSRREILAGAGAALGAGILLPVPAGGVPASLPEERPPAASARAGDSIGLSLNTSTLRGHKLPLAEELELAARTGYQGVEIWVHELDEHRKAGGTLKDIGKRARDLGLSIQNGIAFFPWLVDDPKRRADGLEEARRRVGELAEIGCPRVAAPPAGVDRPIDLLVVAERYRALLEIGSAAGVTAVVEVWGPAPVLSRLGQAALVAIESGHPAAQVLPDVFHLYKGGSGFEGIRCLSGSSIGIFHLNDYPAQPPRSEIKDAQRVFPGDGIAPLRKLVQDLRGIGYRGMLSLELFNAGYYARPAADVAREGLEKARAILAAPAG